MTFVRNHAKGIVACDFFVVVTATFRRFLRVGGHGVGTPRIVLHNLTAHPTGLDLLERVGSWSGESGSSGPPQACAISEGERLLRKTGAHRPARVPELPHPAFRGSPEAHAQ
jgi:hypothetical protein